jgi:hypothetical protein
LDHVDVLHWADAAGPASACRAAGHSLNLVEEIKIEEPIGQLLGRPEEGQ